MFGGKLSKESLHRTFSQVKHHISRGYHSTKQFLGHVDNGIRVAKHIYSALAPAIEHYAGGQVNKHVIRGLGGYEQLRNKVMDSHDTALNHVNQVVGGLKGAGVHIGL